MDGRGEDYGMFRKDGIKLQDIASDLTKMVMHSLEPSKIGPLKKQGVDPNNAEHRLEIVVLSLFSLRSAIFVAQHLSILDQDKGNALLRYVTQLLKISCVDVLKFATIEQFESFLQMRYVGYDNLDIPGSKAPGIGLRFGKNIGINNM
jgi:hypothetical protein